MILDVVVNDEILSKWADRISSQEHCPIAQALSKLVTYNVTVSWHHIRINDGSINAIIQLPREATLWQLKLLDLANTEGYENALAEPITFKLEIPDQYLKQEILCQQQ